MKRNLSRPIPDATADPSKRVLYALLTLLLCALAAYSGRVLPVFRGVLRDYFGITVEKLGLLYTVGLIPGAVVSLIVVSMIDRKGPRPVLRACFAGAALGMCLAALARHWSLMLLAVVIGSCAGTSLFVAAQAYLTSLFPDRRRRVISLSLVTYGIAGILYPLWAEFLLGLSDRHPSIGFDYVLHIPFAALAVPMLVGVFLFRSGTSTAPSPAASSKGLSLRRLSAGTMALIFLATLHAACDTSAALWIPTVLDSSSFPLVTFAPGIVRSAFAVSYVVSRAGLSLLPERTGRRILLVAPGILGGGVFLAGILSRSQALTAAGYVLGGLLWSLEYPAILAWISEREPKQYGRALAISMIGGNIGAFVIANLMGGLAGALNKLRWLAIRFAPGPSYGGMLGESGWWMILRIPACGFPLVGIAGAIWLVRYGPSRRVTPAAPAPAPKTSPPCT